MKIVHAGKTRQMLFIHLVLAQKINQPISNVFGANLFLHNSIFQKKLISNLISTF
jgi:hypothetical protein